MAVRLAMRLLRPKKALMAPMSQMSSSSTPCARRASKSPSSIAA
jgi:hypothetical protein